MLIWSWRPAFAEATKAWDYAQLVNREFPDADIRILVNEGLGVVFTISVEEEWSRSS